MPYRATQAIVLARSAWRENDRILTLFCPEIGRQEALCRGCRKPNSPLMAASELFSLGEYVLFQGKGRQVVQSCSVTEGFYPLRLSYSRLSYANVCAQAVLKAIQPEEPMPKLFILLARTLRRLAFEETPADAVTAAFLLHFASLQGVKPRLNHCVRCEKPLEEGAPGFLLPLEGGVCCPACGIKEPLRRQLAPDSLAWLRRVLATGISSAGPLPASVPYALLADYVSQHLDSRLPEAQPES